MRDPLKGRSQDVPLEASPTFQPPTRFWAVRPPGLPGGEARLAALAAAGVKSRAIVEETAQSQLLPDGLPLILLGLKGKGDKKG